MHGSPLGAEEIAGARKALNWDIAGLRDPGRHPRRLARGRHARRGPARRLGEAPRRRRADRSAEFERRIAGKLPADFDDAIAAYKQKLAADKPKVATRKSTQMALEVINGALPETIGGSADLDGSNLTKTSQTKALTPDNYGNRYMRYGIREHGMAAAMNGIALHRGLIPYGGTFFCLHRLCAAGDPPRLAHGHARHLRHDPRLDRPRRRRPDAPAGRASRRLRAIPNLLVFRPADAVETVECWQIALESDKAPSILALTRQNLPPLRTEYVAENLSRQGRLRARGGRRRRREGDDLRHRLGGRDRGRRARPAAGATASPTSVVSVPCIELFEEQDKAYREKVHRQGARPRSPSRPRIAMGWDRFSAPTAPSSA